MIQPTPIHPFQLRDSVHALLNSEGFMPELPTDPHYPFGLPVASSLPRVVAKLRDVGIGAAVAPSTNAHPSRARPDVLIEDWDVLFGAVTARLRRIIAEGHTTIEASPLDDADRIRVGVLECVEALDQLHAALKAELGQCSQS